jgi:non-ribosomal peptide synthetase component E (peptide arylation enzyme)
MYTFAQPLGRALGIASGSEAVVCQDRRRTYAELGARCRRLAGAMRGLGLARQDRVGGVALNHERIAGFKVPRRIELRGEPLPESAAGKILKRELREPHWTGQQARISGG